MAVVMVATHSFAGADLGVLEWWGCKYNGEIFEATPI
jgi:hypothetical protein